MSLSRLTRYQTELESIYDDFIDRLLKAVDKTDDEYAFWQAQDIGLIFLLQDLSELGQQRIPQAISAAGIRQPSDRLRAFSVLSIDKNNEYLSKSLIPAVRLGLRGVGFIDNDEELKAQLREVLKKYSYRVSSYAGAYWEVHNLALAEKSAGHPLFWALDKQAHHCKTCAEYGDRRYNSFKELLSVSGGAWPAHNTECKHSCRCILERV